MRSSVLQKIIYSAVMSAALFSGLASADQERSGEKQNNSVIDTWQTYSQNYSGGVHSFADNDSPYKVERISKPASTYHTGYAFVDSGRLYFEDRGNNITYQMRIDGSYDVVDLPSNKTYQTSNIKVEFDGGAGVFTACPKNGAQNCKEINVKVGTFPFVFASKGDIVLAVTNYGGALLFKDGAWCRMSMRNDIYSCEGKKSRPPLAEPRKVQFYSSITYQGKVLLGEWPTGRIYEFDGSTLKPSGMTPPKIAAQAGERLGFEAQTMAEYCGDLFVGYWPKGEVWRYGKATKKWELFKRFFSKVDGEPFIPYSDRPADSLNNSFFGQRVTAMVPYEDSLYVTTSNLSSWKSSDKIPETIDPEKISEYGEIYKVTKAGCSTRYGNPERHSD